MIPSNPSPSLAVRAQPACILAGGPQDGPENTAFGTLLAELSGASEDGIAKLETASLDPALALAAASPAQPGNLLPPDLPVAAKVEPKSPNPALAATGKTALPLPDLPAAAPTRPEAGNTGPTAPASLLAVESAVPTAPAPRQVAHPGPPPAEEVRLAIALPRIAQLMTKTDEPELSLPLAEPTLAAPAPLQGQPLTAPQPIGPAGTLRPHDFAALIDRLSAAREGGGPAAVSVTVAHQEFGPVRLHFRPDETGLSVALTSADPEFARAAAAAPAPILPVQQGGASAGLASGQHGASDPAFQGGGAQSRGEGSPRQHGSQQAASNHAAPAPGQPEPSAHHGIFA